MFIFHVYSVILIFYAGISACLAKIVSLRPWKLEHSCYYRPGVVARYHSVRYLPRAICCEQQLK